MDGAEGRGSRDDVASGLFQPIGATGLVEDGNCALAAIWGAGDLPVGLVSCAAGAIGTGSSLTFERVAECWCGTFFVEELFGMADVAAFCDSHAPEDGAIDGVLVGPKAAGVANCPVPYIGSCAGREASLVG